MIAESSRIADQLRRAFDGDAWHGSPLSEILRGVSSASAAARPVPSAHTIWELVLHVDLYVHASIEAIRGAPIPQWEGTGRDWSTLESGTAEGWTTATHRLFENAENLAKAIDLLPDRKLLDIVPGREYDFYHLFQGIVQHSLYHAGQIALLKKEQLNQRL